MIGGSGGLAIVAAGDGQYRDTRPADRGAWSAPRDGRFPARAFRRDLRRGPAGGSGRDPPLWSRRRGPATDRRRPRRDLAARRDRSIWKRSLPAATYDLWLEPLRAIGSSAETLYVTGPPAGADLGRAALPGPARGLAARVSIPASSASSWSIAERGDRRRPAAPWPSPCRSIRRHTFERFVIGSGSRFAHAAALAVAELPGEAYNPLFLHGPPGLGKTHLLGAIAGYYRDHHPELTVHYTTAERFTSEFVAALRTEGPSASRSATAGSTRC